MKVSSHAIAVLASIIFGSASASAASVDISGNSMVAGPLLTDVMNSLIPAFPIMSGCREKLQAIDRKVLSLPENPDIKDGALTSGTIIEQWDFLPAGKSLQYM